MRTAFHITFYYVESRLVYLNQVIDGLNKIPGDNAIYIYTNKNIKPFIKNNKGNIKILRFFYSLDILKPFYKMFGKYPYKHWSRKLGFTFFTHPFYLTWESRKKMEALVDDFDVQVYMEDDILFTDVNFNYWLANKDLCLKYNYNLGFLRYEVDLQNEKKYYSDVTWPLSKVLFLEGKPFAINDIETYNAFWIMDRQELKKFMKSPAWRFEEPGYYPEREISAVGWHGLHMKRYLGTILPLVKATQNSYHIDDDSLIHHIPNTYIGHPRFCKLGYPLVILQATK